ncbi:MAG TPA: cation:proton antiporter [Patescibacteria group bacterium]|nr:cation:proton antiporter [Patescibacteria group bacterium]
MQDLSVSFFFSLVLFLAFPFVFGFLASKVKLPALLGYVVGGVVLGVFLKQDGVDVLSQFAQIGVILLLFTIGLEVDLSRIRRFSRFVFVGGAIQIGITTVLLALLSLLFGLGFMPALLIGLALSLSSTAVVAKIIQDRGEEHSLLGELAIGLLIFQDIAAIPILILTSALGKGSDSSFFVVDLLVSLLRSMVVIGLLYFLGKILVPRIFMRLARVSSEILNLFTVFFIVIVVFLFSFFKVSPGIAAFIAGVLVGATVEHHHIFSRVRPFRDLFAILFFVYLGTFIDIPSFLTHVVQISVFTFFLMLIKSVVVGVIFIFFRFHSRTAFSMGLLLSQVGEFALVILYEGKTAGVISPDTYLFVLSSSLITIAITPLCALKKDTWYFAIRKMLKKRAPTIMSFIDIHDKEPAHIDAFDITNHVVVCGFGRLGFYIGRALSMAHIPYIAIDYNVHIIEINRRKGISVIYGDPTDIDVLDYAQTEKATLLVAALPDRISQEMVMLNARRLNPHITIFTRVHKAGDSTRMKDLGANVVIQPEFEAAISMVKKVYINFRLPKEEIIGKIKRLKLEHGMA